MAHWVTARSTSRLTGPGLPGGSERSKHMTSPRAEPGRAPGLKPSVGMPPGETPPAEGGTSGISYPEPELRKGWGPMPLALIMLVVALVAVGLIAMAVVLLV
ncbi:DUF6480 family protein [Streptomyces sp. NPDC055059]